MIETPASVCWALVPVFYTAHELAHAVLDVEPGLHQPFRHPSNHAGVDHAKPGTNFALKRHFRQISPTYATLYSIGRGVRYDGATYSRSEVEDFINHELATVRRWARERLTSAHEPVLNDWP